MQAATRCPRWPNEQELAALLLRLLGIYFVAWTVTKGVAVANSVSLIAREFDWGDPLTWEASLDTASTVVALIIGIYFVIGGQWVFEKVLAPIACRPPEGALADIQSRSSDDHPTAGCSRSAHAERPQSAAAPLAERAMPVITDEKVLSFDGFVSTDPALGMREQAQNLLASHAWSTSQVWYGDQYEPTDPYGDGSPPQPDEEVEMIPRWSMCFNLGLDHVDGSNATWFADVSAIIQFLQHVCSTAGDDNEFVVDVRSRFKPWYSEIVGFITNEPPNLDVIRVLIEDLIFRRWPT
jgi:hypothetical protein